MEDNVLFLLAFVSSITMSVFSSSSIIDYSKRFGMVDNPLIEDRKIHSREIPNMGGIGVFLSAMCCFFAFDSYPTCFNPSKLFSIAILLFFVGLRDDLSPVKAYKRLLFEFFCAIFIILITDIRIRNLYGIFRITDLSLIGSYLISVVFIVGCINAYNMIDGIDGLLGGLSLLGLIVFSFIFYNANELSWLLFCLCLSGGIVGFLFYNWQPAKLFMGNGGSMFLGTLFACLSLYVMQMDKVVGPLMTITMPQTITLGIVAIPIFDLLLVVLIRLYHKKSPFDADKNHTHHRLLDLGLEHWQAVLVLIFANVLILLFAFWVQNTGALRSIIFTLGFCLLLELILMLVHKIILDQRNGKMKI